MNASAHTARAPACDAPLSDEHAQQLGWVMALVASALLFGLIIRVQPVSNVNDGSRWDTVWSLVNGKGYVIDNAPYGTIDKIYRDGHYYSSKPPLMMTVIAGPVWLLQRFTRYSIPDYAWVVNRLVLLFVNVIPFCAFIVLLNRLLDRYGAGMLARLFCLSAAAFGTYVTAYSMTLNNHTQGATAAMLALYCLIRVVYDGRREWYYFALCGLFACWTVASEMVAAVFAVAALVWLFRTDARKTLACFVPVAAVMGAAYLYTTHRVTGTILPAQTLFNTALYHYPGSYWNTPVGVDALAEPKWFYALNLLIGHHGLFSLTPVFAVGIYGMIKDRKLRGIHNLGLALTAGLFVFYTFKTNNYAGVAQGPRWLFWMTPFWLLGLVPALQMHFTSRKFRAFALVALLVSVMTIGHAITGNKDLGRPGPWGTSWMHVLMRHAGIINY